MPARTLPTRFLTGACRCEVPSSAAPREARASTAAGRILAGPQPKRPSAGSRSAGILSALTGVDSVTVPAPARRVSCPGRLSGMPDLAAERLDYSGEQLLETDVPADPYTLFGRWL